MKRLIAIFFIFFISILPVQSKIITGEIEYNAETAEREVFSSPVEPISFNYIRNHLFDSNAVENITSLLSGITEFQDRKAALFSDGSYGVMYYDDPYYTWIYKNGKLINFSKKSSLEYPAKITRYKADGSIINIGLKISEQESYIYSTDGKLIAHWLGKNCYDKNNNIIMTRKTITTSPF